MALTKVSTDGVKDDAITKTKIPANQIEASELADNAVDTNAIADQAVALSKLPHGTSSNDGKFLRANNGADPTFETVTSTTINNNADNRVITGSGTANTLNAESGVVIESNGRLGVGTTNPSAPLHIYHATTNAVAQFQSGDSDADIKLLDNSTTQSVGIGASGNNLRILAGDNTRMYVGSSGNVGIGTTSPSQNLHNTGTTRLDGKLGVGSTASHAQIVSYVTGTESYPPSGGLVQADNSSHGLQVWNGNNSAAYSALKLETKTTGASIWLMSNVYNSNFSGDLTFITRTGGSSNAERVRFRRDGGITFNGDTAAANALSDYEEGSWTPTVDQGTLSHVSAQYTKIGRLVMFAARIYNFSNTTSSSELALGGLPYNVAGSADDVACGVVMYSNISQANNVIMYIGSNSKVYWYAGHLGAFDNIKHANLSSNTDVYLQGQYQAA